MGRLQYLLLALSLVLTISSCASPSSSDATDAHPTESTVAPEDKDRHASDEDTDEHREQADIVVQIDLDQVVIDGEVVADLEDGDFRKKDHFDQNEEALMIPAVSNALDASKNAPSTRPAHLFIELNRMVPYETLTKVLYTSGQAESGPSSDYPWVTLKIGDEQSFEIYLPKITIAPPDLSSPTEKRPLNISTRVAEAGIYLAADAQTLEGPEECPESLTVCHKQEDSLEDSVEAVRQIADEQEALSRYATAVNAYNWHRLRPMWNQVLEDHPPENYGARDILYISMDNWMPVDLLTNIRNANCRQSVDLENGGCDPLFETLIISIGR